MTAKSATHSMQDLLDAIMREQRKESAENLEPGTSSSLSGTPEGETTYTEGQTSQESDQFIREELGSRGALGAPHPDTNNGDFNQAHRAAKIAPTGEDPESESSSKEPPMEAEPGTSATELNRSEKVSNWIKNATELLVEYSVDARVSGDSVKQPAAKEAEDTQPKESGNAKDFDNPYMALAEGDEETAKQAYDVVQSKLVASQLDGEKLAYVTACYLNDLIKQAEEGEEAASEPGDDAGEADAAPAEAAAAPAEEMPMPPGGGDEGGGMGGEMGGGDPAEAQMLAENPEIIEQAIAELAGEVGVSPEELVQMLEAELQGGGGGGGADMGGGMGGGAGLPPEAAMAGGGEMPKMSADLGSRLKVAAAISNVKKRAIDILREKALRSR